MKSYLLVFLVFVFISNCIHETSGNGSDENMDEDYSFVYGQYPDDSESSEEIIIRTESPYPKATNPRNRTIRTTTRKPIRNTTTARNVLSTSPFEGVFTPAPTIKSSTYDLKCPQNCKCSDKIAIVDCSHQNLKEIPKNLPPSTVYLNLSYNSLTTLNVSDLINCSELRELDVNNNQIKKIVNSDDFAKLPSLRQIDLSTNAFEPLQGKEFSKARGLITLLLSSNKDIAASNVPIIQTEKLKTLYLVNCSINQLSENIFQNLSSLVTLNLDNNPLNMTQAVNAFKYLTNLRRLFIPTVPQNIAPVLCKNLQVIDIINLSLENHDISCFLLSENSQYEESTIRTDLFKIPTDSPLNSAIVEISSTANIPNEEDIPSDLEATPDALIIQSETTYEKMSIMYMILTGLVLILMVAILSVLCIIGSRQLGKELLYRKQNYRKYLAGNLTVENPNYE